MFKKLFATTLLISLIIVSTGCNQITENTDSNEEDGGGSLTFEGDADTNAIDTDISTWTTYTNDSCNFSIKFPEPYVVISDMDTCADETNYDEMTYHVVHIANQDGCLITQPGEQYPEDCEIHEIFLGNTELSATGPNLTHSTVLVDGIESTQISGTEEQIGQINISIPYNDIWYKYIYSFAPENFEIAEATFKKILSTIEFN